MVMRVSDQRDRPRALRAREVFLATEGNLPEGIGVYVALAKDATALSRYPLLRNTRECGYNALRLDDRTQEAGHLPGAISDQRQ
jgi:hypothetical protein